MNLSPLELAIIVGVVMAGSAPVALAAMRPELKKHMALAIAFDVAMTGLVAGYVVWRTMAR